VVEAAAREVEVAAELMSPLVVSAEDKRLLASGRSILANVQVGILQARLSSKATR
jgi:hypothetical protein